MQVGDNVWDVLVRLPFSVRKEEAVTLVGVGGTWFAPPERATVERVCHSAVKRSDKRPEWII